MVRTDSIGAAPRMPDHRHRHHRHHSREAPTMTARYVGLWHGGANYSAPTADDAELFDSIEQAADSLRDRYAMGHHFPQTFRNAFRASSRDLTPCAHDNGSGWLRLYRVSPGNLSVPALRVALHDYLSSDAAPDVTLSFGPRGGIRRGSGTEDD